MSNSSQKLLLQLLCFFLGSILSFLISALLLSGNNDWALFVQHDLIPDNIKLSFVLSFLFILGAAQAICFRILLLPQYDQFARIILVVIGLFLALGLSLAFLRIPLLSRTIFVAQFSLIVLLVTVVFRLQHKIIPQTIGLIPGDRIPEIDNDPLVRWLIVKDDLSNLSEIDGIAASLKEYEFVGKSDLLVKLANTSLPLLDKEALIERLTGKLDLNSLSHTQLDKMKPSNSLILAKRITDICIVICLGPVLFFLTLIIAVLIKVDSKGPILFLQERVGFHGHSFKLLKFRSMVVGAEDQGHRFAAKNDDRVTRVGRFLRRTRLDELPQLWNVLMGDMNIVGPRPEQRTFYDEFIHTIPFFGFRQIVRPGITGWAQISYGYASSEDETRKKFGFDLFYIKNMSMWLDAVILIKTFNTIIFGSRLDNGFSKD